MRETLSVKHKSLHPVTYHLHHQHTGQVRFHIHPVEFDAFVSEDAEWVVKIRMLSEFIVSVSYFLYNRGSYYFPILTFDILSDEPHESTSESIL